MSTSIGSGEQFPTGRWPDQLSHDPNSAVFHHSVNNDVQIEALDHLQIFLFDQDGGEPYTMTVTLPIIENLPGQGRMYLFYVERCHMGDQMVFKVVPGSGDRVNRDLVQHAFTLDGRKTLFFAVGLNGDYLIHPFSGTEPGSTVGLPPTIQYNLLPQSIPGELYVEYEDYGGFDGVGIMSTLPTLVLSSENVVAGMEGFITVDVPIPAQNFYGFRCERSGWYNVTPNIEWFVQWAPPDVPTSSFPNYLFFKEFSPGGFNTFGYYYTCSGSQVLTPDPMTGFLATISSPQLIYMQEGYYYACQLVYNGEPTGSLPVIFYTGRWGTITFQYYGPGSVTPPPAAPLALLARSSQEKELVVASEKRKDIPPWTPWAKKNFIPPIKKGIVLSSPETKEDTLPIRKEKQKQILREMEQIQAEKKKDLEKAERETIPPPSSISLNDIEKVFSRMVNESKKRKRG